MTVTFLGHRDTPLEIQPLLEAALKNLIEKDNANSFYVGNQGSFDHMVRKTLKLLKTEYPHINYAVVLSYMPGKRDEYDNTDYSDTIYPECLGNTPRRYAISKRNHWMIERADTAVTYVTTAIGGAAQFKRFAENKGKRVINLSG